MDIRSQSWWSKKIQIAGTVSNTIVASASGYRWNLNTALFSWVGATACSTFTLYEIDETNSAVFFRFMATTPDGYASFYFAGATASATGTRLMFNTGVASCAITAHFTGW